MMLQERCRTCDKEFAVPLLNRRWVCCNGQDCGCYGATIPNEFCSSECYENYEPPEDDGECFRGDEAEAYQRDEQARIRRGLK